MTLSPNHPMRADLERHLLHHHEMTWTQVHGEVQLLECFARSLADKMPVEAWREFNGLEWTSRPGSMTNYTVAFAAMFNHAPMDDEWQDELALLLEPDALAFVLATVAALVREEA